MTIPDALRAATVQLAVSSDTARLDAELLMAHALGQSRNDLLLRQRDLTVPEIFASLLARRLNGEPIAHITGARDFWTITLSVTPDTLIPRPDSETLIEAAVDHFAARAPATILDLGTGSGALLLAALAEWPDAQGVGIDASAPALAVAQGNAARLGMADAPDLPRLIGRGGMAAIEIGYDQAASVTALLRENGLAVALRRDLSGHDRCLIATNPD
jgi:release factor glutamine methyltransferase